VIDTGMPSANPAGGAPSAAPSTPGAPTPGGGTDFGDNGDLACTGGCAFPTAPLLDANVTQADIAPLTKDTKFSAGSLCVIEPQLSTASAAGTLFPRNWLRPRFRWASSGGETLWEIRLHADGQPDDLLAYTKDTQWLLPAEVWKKMGAIGTVHVTLRGLGQGGAVSGVEGDFSVAPVDAGGSMVFWATESSYVDDKSPSRLLGFSVGDEAVVETLRATDIATNNIPSEGGDQPRGYYKCGGATPRPTCTAQPNNPACCDPTGYTYGDVECVGCHVSTPDGKAVIFTDNWPWDKVAASIEPGKAGQLPATVTPYASELLKQPWLGMQALSPKYFATTAGGERILVTTYGHRNNPGSAPYDATQPTKHELAWFNLAADDTATNPIPTVIPPDPQLPGQTQNIYQVRDLRNKAVGAEFGVSWGLITTLGENGSIVTPSWSNDGAEIAYVSTEKSSTDGHPDWGANTADIHVVPYNNKGGGTVVPLQGASDPNFLEYYPQYSADDAFIAFARAPKPSVATRCMPSQDANGVVSTCPATDLGENPDGPYYNRNGEIFIVKRGGASPSAWSRTTP